MERSRRRIDALMMAFTAYMADRKPKPLSRETRYNYRGRVARAMTAAQRGGHSLLAGDVRTLRYVLGQFSPHPTTQTGYIAALSCFYDFLIAQGLRKDNPARLVGRPPQRRGTPRPLTLDACLLYLAAAVELGPMYEAIAVLGLFQGWRRSEIRFAQWRWFFEAGGEVWADVTGKGSRTSRVHVHERTRGMLARLRGSHADPTWLLPSPTRSGEPIGGTWISNAHRRIEVAAGLEPGACRLHQMRHTYATYLRAAGGDQAIVQRGLRHADPKSTAIYMEVFPEELARVHGRLDYGAMARAAQTVGQGRLFRNVEQSEQMLTPMGAEPPQ